MREIKFRGKRIDNDEWVYGNLIGNDVIVGNIVEWDSEYFCTEFWQKVDPETVGQYTGLKDRSGKEIYEGDIITDNLGTGKVSYCESKGAFRVKYHNYHYGSGKWFVDFTDNELKTIEIIGNIYEHPHLLTGGTSDE